MLSKEFEQNLKVPILNNSFYIECIRLAELSKAKNQRYGSLLVKNGNILGRGYNRSVICTPSDKPDGIIRQGYCNHAEIEALNDAIINGNNIKDAEIYVGGYFPKENNLLFLHNEYTCLRCPPILKKFEVNVINIPTPDGWMAKKLDESFLEARKYINGGTYNSRILSVINKLTLSDLQTSK